MTQIFDSLGWALLHSLWQGGLAMLAVILFRGLTKNAAPSLRYNFQILCLFGCFAAFLVTFGLYQSSGEAPAGFKNLSATETVIQAAALITGSAENLQVTSQNLTVSAAASAPLIGLLWCLGFAVMATRYLTAYVLTQRLRRFGLKEVPTDWQNRFRTLVLNTGVSDKVRLYISSHVFGPLTIGFIKPVVLVPAGFLMGLPRDQVEAILLHELAHIRRYDYLVNLFQTAIKTVLFYHPAIHYISKKIDIDREQACDDLAVAQSRDPQALVRGLASLRLKTSGQGFAMAADDGDTPLMDRLKRLVGSVEHQRRSEHLLMPLIATLMISGIYVSTTSVANAHPEPAEYEHTKADKQNYKFQTKRLNGRNVTVKITEDGRRWVLSDGSWVDIDKNPRVINRLPVAMPQPPAPPQLKYKNGEFDSASFDDKMNQFQVDMDYFEADLARYFEENNELSERDQERLERKIERQVERDENEIERQAERLEERLEAQMEREEARREAQLDRAEDARERAEERREAQMERAEAQRERAQEQRERAQERYEREAEHIKHGHYDQMRETLYGYLIGDGLAASRSEKITIRYVDNSWTANGHVIPEAAEEKYCSLFANMGIIKSTLVKIEISPDSTHLMSQSSSLSGKDKRTHKITIGKHIHKDGSVHDPSQPVAPPAPPAIMQKASLKAPTFVWPTQAGRITAKYGQIGKIWNQPHQGIDIKGQIGAPVLASADGVVHLVTTEPKWGHRIVLKHADGFQSLYGHMNGFAVSRGQTVQAGDLIGGVGNTGQSTGPHLHFEIRKDGQTLDPATLIN